MGLFPKFVSTCLRGCAQPIALHIPNLGANGYDRNKVQSQDPYTKCTVEVSYLEIYNGLNAP